ncbi:uncharacterized protein LOC128278930 [Anopheles cruzii]|uniref:uncharacterized protein LOC128278930 n=1 Tax=Anopheles cruzii TaxID=68878 RepID=UPI0022EC7EBA|nr:uncharacterized protein LOC128278930 [Anopheles cruzii]
MFSRLCKNTIFPMGVNQSPATSSVTEPSSSASSSSRSEQQVDAARPETVTSQTASQQGDTSGRPPVLLSANAVGGSVSVVAAAIVADRRRHRQQQQLLGGRNLPSLPVLPARSRDPIRAQEPPPPYWAHYAHRPVPTVSVAAGSVAGPSVGRSGGAAGPVGGHNSVSTTDDSDTSNDRPHYGRSAFGESSSASGSRGGAGDDDGTVPSIAAHVVHEHDGGGTRHRYNVPHQQRQRMKEHLLSQDAFCPDLVRNCKNIATKSSDRQSSPAPGEYAEIVDLSRSLVTKVAIHSGASTSTISTGADAHDLHVETNSVTAGQSVLIATSDQSACTVRGATMGQNLSIRRPKISLTWVLREQSREGASSGSGQTHHNEQQQPHQGTIVVLPSTRKSSSTGSALTAAEKVAQNVSGSAGVQPVLASNRPSNVNGEESSIVGQPNGTALGGHSHHHHHVIVRKKLRTRSKEQMFSEKYVSDNNLSEYHSDKLRTVASFANDYVTAPSVSGGSTNIYRKSNRKNSDRLKKKDRFLLYSNGSTVDAGVAHHNNNNQHAVNLNKDTVHGEGHAKDKLADTLKNTHSEPSLYTTVSEPSASTKQRHHRHHHRRRRERYRSQRFGYEINNVDEFLSKCSLSSPGNIPVVLSSAATLYQTRPGSYQIEIPLPLGMVVNAVFKNQNWLYVQTPHAEEGYVAYDTCLPLGILPSNQRATSSSKPTPCWESNKDVFPKLCGNLTDSEKEIQQLRGGTRSEGRRTPRLKRSSANSRSAASITTCNSERDLDSLYLRTVASNLPKVADGQAQYAQLKLTTKVLHSVAPSMKSEKTLAIEQLEKMICSGSGDYVHLLKQQQQQLLHKQYQYLQQIRQQQIARGLDRGSQIVSGSNHLRIALGGSANLASNGVPVTACSSAAAVRQTLLAITDNYCSEALNVQKGDVVTLLACKEYQEKGLKNYKQWFFVRTRDGHEGYIPAEAAGHGFL